MIDIIVIAIVGLSLLVIFFMFLLYLFMRRSNVKAWIFKINDSGELISKEIKKAFYDKSKGTLVVREGFLGNRPVHDFMPSLIRGDKTIELADFEGNLIPLRLKVEASDLISAKPILTPAGKKNIVRDTMEVAKKVKMDASRKMYYISIAVFVLVLFVSVALLSIVIGSFNSGVDKFVQVAEANRCNVVIDYANLTKIAQNTIPPG